MTKYGKYNPDGSVANEATECILTGRSIAAPFDTTIRHRVPGTNYFYRVLGSQYHLVTDELREGWESDAKALDKPAPTFKLGKANEKSEVKE